jgi:hypothetical protein
MATTINNVEYQVDPVSTTCTYMYSESARNITKTLNGTKLNLTKTGSDYRNSEYISHDVQFTKDDPIDSNLLQILLGIYETQTKANFQFEEYNREAGTLSLIDQDDAVYVYATHQYPILPIDTSSIVINSNKLSDTSVTVDSTDEKYGILKLKSEKLDLSKAKVYATYNVDVLGYITKISYSNLRLFNDLYECNIVIHQLIKEQ